MIAVSKHFCLPIITFIIIIFSHMLGEYTIPGGTVLLPVGPDGPLVGRPPGFLVGSPPGGLGGPMVGRPMLSKG